jgi:subtilase family serine protease
MQTQGNLSDQAWASSDCRKRRFIAISRAAIEQLETRRLLSISPLFTPAQLKIPATWTASPQYKFASFRPDDTSSPVGITPAQMEGAYGANSIVFGSVKGDGSGQTIAIVDAYDYPSALSDLNAFSAYFSLPQFNGGTGTPTFTKLNQNGAASPLPGTDPAGAGNDWEIEEALDIEWAHSVAPKANIDLVEANDATGNLFTTDQTAANLPGVSVVSNSWGGAEYSGETATDSIFNHTGVTFLDAAGDTGAYASDSRTITPDYPASSPDVVTVGGTILTVSAGNTYGSETAWGDGTSSGYEGGGGGGISSYEPIPSYQVGNINGISSASRTYPDVSLNAAAGVPIYDTYDFGSVDPWSEVGGTSLACPMWAGLIAIADQGRTIAGAGALTGPTQTLPDLYSLSSSDYHDITTGNNGYATRVGYDLASGIGTPIANVLVPALLPAAPAVIAPVITTSPISQTLTVGQTATFTAAATGTPVPTIQWMVQTPGTTSFTAISGATSTTLNLGAATIADSGNQYEAVFSNGVGSPIATTIATLTVNPAASTGSLSGTASTAASAYNLTSLGTSDWAHWGLGGIYGNFDHKAMGNSQISNVTPFAIGNYGGYHNTSRSVFWTDGTPQTNDTGDDGYIWANNAIGAGYSFTAPADTTTRTLDIYLGGYSSGATLTATLSDGSAAPYTVSFTGTALYTDLVAITFKANSANQKITINYTKTTNVNSIGGSADLIAAWLVGAPVSSAPVVTTNPTTQTVTVGQTVTFTAAASGTPTPSVQWMVETAGSSSFAAISGATSTTLNLGTATLAESGNKYEAVFSNGVGTSATTTPATLTVNAAATGGSLAGTAASAAASYNLTTLGTTDWAHWGRSGVATNVDHKSTGASQISAVTQLGAGQHGAYTNTSRDVIWTDGTPTATDSGDDGYLWANTAIGAGYSFTAPASTTTHTLYIYLGGYSSGSTLTATLSDNSATPYTVSFTGTGTYNEIVAITYKAASASQKLTISYTKSSNINGTGGSSDLIAAWLQ